MRTSDVWLLGLTVLALGAAAGLVYRAHHQNDVHVPEVLTDAMEAKLSPPQPVQRSLERRDSAWFSSWDKLPKGYRCSGGGGPVYRVKVVNGVSEVEPLMVNGRLARCGGGFFYRNDEPLPPDARIVQ